MSTEDNLALLESLEGRNTKLRRRAGLVALGSVASAALVMAVLIFAAYCQLEGFRAQIETEKENIKKLQDQKKDLQDDIRKLEQNYEAFAPNAPTSAAARAEQTPESQPATSVKPRVYLQIVDRADEDYAKDREALLVQAGFQVMGIEYVEKARGLRNTEVRYYKKADEAKAQKIVEELQASDSSVTIVYLGLETSTKVRPGHYEVWFRAQTSR